ncbi:hypothetical protein [Dactylosporangium salmoneum]|uniref:hypothetical protein n=1 Tax=Dactylosporangium salmoneum TaxID=53361 RepID=UPI0031D70192
MLSVATWNVLHRIHAENHGEEVAAGRAGPGPLTRHCGDVPPPPCGASPRAYRRVQWIERAVEPEQAAGLVHEGPHPRRPLIRRGHRGVGTRP